MARGTCGWVRGCRGEVRWQVNDAAVYMSAHGSAHGSISSMAGYLSLAMSKNDWLRHTLPHCIRLWVFVHQANALPLVKKKELLLAESLYCPVLVETQRCFQWRECRARANHSDDDEGKRNKYISL